ncbi:MAG: DNA-3-methyladenine glycosylase 2 family protein [Sulfitobacter sp.]|nr:DNA-3-methyladenine glycosylase 2 family protein [Sulfitobacter sp.]
MRRIETAAQLAEGATWLAARDPILGAALDRIGPLPLRLRPDGFSGLLDIVVSQQVSVASADAIRRRMAEAELTDAAAVRAAGEEGLRAVGFSRPKARYGLILAEADLDYAELRLLPDAQVAARLMALTGIGPWTAQIYLMFCLGRTDVFAPGDLALQEAAKLLYDLPARPGAVELAQMAELWSPWRAVAARALFAYYRYSKNRDGL